VSWPADAPVPKHFTKQLPPKKLLATLSSTCLSSVHLFWDTEEGQWPPPPALPPMIVSALAPRSASTLTALHDLPLVKRWVEPLPDDTGLGLAALTQLRALTLRQTWEELAELRADDFPLSLEDLTLVMEHPDYVEAVWEDLPRFVAFDRLQNLRRITISEYWVLKTRWHPALLPPSLEVMHGRPSGHSAKPIATLLKLSAPEPCETLLPAGISAGDDP